MSPTTVHVTFPVTLEREGSFTWPYQGYGDREVTRQLRAEVTFSGVDDEPVVHPIDKAVWEDAMGPEVVAGKKADEWIGAEEQAIEFAWQKLQRQMSEAS